MPSTTSICLYAEAAQVTGNKSAIAVGWLFQRMNTGGHKGLSEEEFPRSEEQRIRSYKKNKGQLNHGNNQITLGPYKVPNFGQCFSGV